jgi:hypothetical protein
MNANREPEESEAWMVLAESFRRGLAETSGELPPLGLATAVVARWSADRAHWELGVLEWISIRLALVTAVAAVAVWAGWFWTSGPVLGDEWVDLPPIEEVAL